MYIRRHWVAALVGTAEEGLEVAERLGRARAARDPLRLACRSIPRVGDEPTALRHPFDWRSSRFPTSAIWALVYSVAVARAKLKSRVGVGHCLAGVGGLEPAADVRRAFGFVGLIALGVLPVLIAIVLAIASSSPDLAE